VIVEPVTDERGAIVRPDLLAAAEPVHRQLRTELPADYRRRLEAVFASGAQMAVALDGGRVAGLAVFRIIEKTFSGRELYCDDLVTDEAVRSKGAGRAMMAHLERVARERGCDTFALDSGCQRQRAHKFYFREGLAITAFRFQKKLS
jgi:GNAT superfamily N-acetyltransferase